MTLYVLGGGAVALPIVYLRDIHDEFVLPKLVFAQVLLACLLLLHGLRWAAGGRLILHRTPLDLPVLAFIGSAVIATVFSVNRSVSIFGTYIRYEGLITLVTYAALFWVTAQTVQTADRARILFRSMLAGGFLVAIIAVIQWVVTSLTFPPGTNSDFSYAGLPRASATMSNPTMLGAFLAMLIPLAVGALLEARSLTGRILAGNAVFMMSLGLALTFVRSAWLGALVGVLVAVLAPQRIPPRIRLGMTGAGLALVIAIVAAGAAARGGMPLIPTLIQRTASIAANVGTTKARIRVWQGTLGLVASRPLTGYGPDTFALVYPRFRLSNANPGSFIDKAHSEILQVAASQGLLGVAAYLWILASLGMSFWRGRRRSYAAASAGGIIAYQLWAQANFSWVPAAVPYWIFLGGAVAVWEGELPARRPLALPRTPALAAAAIVGLSLLVWVTASASRTRSADAAFATGLIAEGRGNLATARASLAEARRLAPQESQYAFDAGRVMLESPLPGQARWLAANEAFSDAVRLGTPYSAAFYDLALTDLQLGRRTAAVEALRRAIELSPWDAASQALLRQVNGA